MNPSPGSIRALVVEQIVRDEAVLAGDPHYHVPSADFYIERILAFKTWLQEIDSEA